MDSTTEKLVAYAREFSPDDWRPGVRAAAIDRVVDSLACAVVGYTSEPARAAIESARGYTSPHPATVLGAGFAASEELAAFANTTMVRSYDWNDGMLAQGGGHPSDM